MKILIIANGIIGDDPSPSGGDVRFLLLAKQWEENGAEIHILSSQGCEKLIDLFDLSAVLHILPWDDKGEVKRSSFIVRAWQAYTSLPSSLRDFDGCIYTANDSLFDVLSGWRLKSWLGRDCFWSAIVHWVPPFPPWKRRQSSVINACLFYLNVRISVFLAAKFADVLLPVSMSTARQLLDLGVEENKLHPVKCGVDFQNIRRMAKLNTNKKYDAIFMKRIQGVKGAFDLVKIWSKVVQSIPNATLAILGDAGEDGGVVKQQILSAGLQRNIKFLGYIYDVERKFTEISSASLFILPSYEENWAISLGEAMCAGLPCIAYNLPELMEIWEDKVEWIPVGDTKSFSEQILRYLNNPKLVRHRSIQGIQFTEQFDWPTLAVEEMSVITNSNSAKKKNCKTSVKS